MFTSDHALKLEWLPNWIAIIGSGYIGLEFSDVYTALGTEVTFIEVGGAGRGGERGRARGEGESRGKQGECCTLFLPSLVL